MKIIFVDGPAGAGKTTWANDLATGLGLPVVHMDDLYQGWDGLEAGFTRLEQLVLQPLAQGRPALFNAHDWLNPSVAGPPVWIASTNSLVVEGCGCAPRAAASWIDTLVWLDGPWQRRLEACLARDAGVTREELVAWERSSRLYFAKERTSQRSDVKLVR
ncbi:MAG: uridine kinase [Micrococcales bacterium]|nr:uridine kinase [Micrococcales bacterium]